MIFDLDHWEWKSLEDFVAYKDMHEFVHNPWALNIHTSSIRYLVIDPTHHPEDTDTELRNEAQNTIKRSLFHFASQTIVSLCTTYEVATKQFFKCLFVMHPMSMHDFIGADYQKGTLKLKDVIDAISYERVIENAAEKAASAATKGKYAEMLKRAAKLSKGAVDDGLVKKIDTLQSLRNKIVHEKHIPPLSVEDVADAQRQIAKAIETLGHLSLKVGLPGRYTYICPDVNSFVTSIAMVKSEQA